MQPEGLRVKEKRYVECSGSGSYGGKCFMVVVDGKLMKKKDRGAICEHCRDSSYLGKAPSMEENDKVNTQTLFKATKVNKKEYDERMREGIMTLNMDNGERLFDIRTYKIDTPSPAFLKIVTKIEKNGRIIAEAKGTGEALPMKDFGPGEFEDEDEYEEFLERLHEILKSEGFCKEMLLIDFKDTTAEDLLAMAEGKKPWPAGQVVEI